MNNGAYVGIRATTQLYLRYLLLNSRPAAPSWSTGVVQDTLAIRQMIEKGGIGVSDFGPHAPRNQRRGRSICWCGSPWRAAENDPVPHVDQAVLECLGDCRASAGQVLLQAGCTVLNRALRALYVEGKSSNALLHLGAPCGHACGLLSPTWPALFSEPCRNPVCVSTAPRVRSRWSRRRGW